MKPRVIKIDDVVVIVTGCSGCPVYGNNDEMGDEWCQHPVFKQSIDKTDFTEETRHIYEAFPSFCELKEVES